MSHPDEFYNRLLTLFAEKLNLEVPTIDTDLVDKGMIDSMTFVDLLTHLEREFGVTISTDALELENFRTVAKIAEFIANNSKNGISK